MNKNKLIILIILIIGFAFISQAYAEDLNETLENENDDFSFKQLSDEINQTSESQTLDLNHNYKNTDNSTYITISKSVTLDGKGHTIDANNQSRVFLIKSDNVCIKNTIFINANSKNLAGGTISWLGNNATLINCKFINSKSVSGGGAIYFGGNNVSLKDCEFSNNEVEIGADISLTKGEGFNRSMIHIQTVNSEGGALFFNGNNIAIENLKFINNTACLNGGAISFRWAANINISNSKFKNNRAQYNGGAIELNGDNFTLIKSVFSANQAQDSNDLFLNSQNNSIINSRFESKSNIEYWYDAEFINVSFSNRGSFEELAEKINNADSILILDEDYEYLNGSNKGILINKSITIDGQGHNIYANKLSRIFNITSDNVTLININFIDGNAFGRYFATVYGGGAIYWNGGNGKIINCSFINNTGSGIEDDPFDREEEYIDENGMMIHIFRVRPMGATINRGGAIVWNGTDGYVENCLFENNHVGYPNYGGAIFWIGENGHIINSEFYNNGAWGGSAIFWRGNNGTIELSNFLNYGICDNGIFWAGANGTVRNSIILSPNARPSIYSYGVELNLQDNWIGNNGNSSLILNLTSNKNFANKGDVISVTADLGNANLKDFNITLNNGDKITLKNGYCNFTYVAEKTGFVNVTFEYSGLSIIIKSGVKIISNDLTKYYKSSSQFKVKVYNLYAKPAKNVYVKFTVSKKSYKVKTDKNGIAKLNINFKPGKYTITTIYDGYKVKNRITVKNILITKNINKKSKKTAKFNVKVLNSKGKTFKNQIVKITFKGKTYKIKTNSKGIAVFKLSKNLKIGKYTIKTSYKSLTVKNKITVKK